MLADIGDDGHETRLTLDCGKSTGRWGADASGPQPIGTGFGEEFCLGAIARCDRLWLEDTVRAPKANLRSCSPPPAHSKSPFVTTGPNIDGTDGSISQSSYGHNFEDFVCYISIFICNIHFSSFFIRIILHSTPRYG